MKILRMHTLFIGLMILGFGVLSVSGQNTIDQAIQQVKSVIDPDPIKQNELRAEEAKKIIMARIRTINPDGKVDDNLKDIDTELEQLRNSNVGGEELINWTWEHQAGRCDEQVNLMKKILDASGVKITSVTSTLNHTFVLVNLASGADPDIPWSWGPNAIAPDTWLGKTLKPEDSWKEKWHFDYGKGFVAEAKVPSSTRQYLEKLGNSKNPNAIDSDCKAKLYRGAMPIVLDYREMLNNYFKIPEEYRKGLEFRPKEDLAIEKAENEFRECMQRFNELERNSSEYVTESARIHAQLSDLDGRLMELGRCCDAEELKQLRSRINGLLRVMPNMRTDASIGAISDVITDEVPDDITKNTGQVKVDQYFVLLLTNASNGLFIGTVESIKESVRCSFTGGGINCKPTDLVTYKKLLGPFATRAEAQDALCKSITESRIFPIGIGLKGRWQGSNTWYGLWDVSISDCPSH